MQNIKVLIIPMMAKFVNSMKEFYYYFQDGLTCRGVKLSMSDEVKTDSIDPSEGESMCDIYFENTKGLSIHIIFIDYYNVWIHFATPIWVNSNRFHPEKLNDDAVMDMLACFLKNKVKSGPELTTFVAKFNELVKIKEQAK